MIVKMTTGSAYWKAPILAANQATTGLNWELASEIVQENKKVRDQAGHRSASQGRNAANAPTLKHTR